MAMVNNQRVHVDEIRSLLEIYQRCLFGHWIIAIRYAWIATKKARKKSTILHRLSMRSMMIMELE